jgi:hypothetical protein
MDIPSLKNNYFLTGKPIIQVFQPEKKSLKNQLRKGAEIIAFHVFPLTSSN